MRDGVPFSSRVVSDGTLRVLALLTMLHDPRHRGVVCFEEPENGVHPGRLRDFVRTLRSMVTAPGDSTGSGSASSSTVARAVFDPVSLNDKVFRGSSEFATDAEIHHHWSPGEHMVIRRTGDGTRVAVLGSGNQSGPIVQAR